MAANYLRYVDETYMCGGGWRGESLSQQQLANVLIGVLSKRASDAILIDTPIYGTHAIKLQFRHTSDLL